ncbi:hypothetical protein R4391_36685 [Mycolicibacterium fortuitum]|nr:hypothetical protein [Mycolicibacterium fortuitum]MDV7195778.1 hypothetical protein [Mycolicibacterium fortuitum]
MLTYTQASKINARHKMFFYAIELLTSKRYRSCCVERSYVRRVLDYFLSLEDSKEQSEAKKIDIDYVKIWEQLHDSCVGSKRSEDLTVCYLSGPEPQNDFKELISHGIHPQNIWAFEINQSTYDVAIKNYVNVFPQPKIVKQSIEQFFIHTPKKFDIVYIDACGAIASEKQCLRIIATLCKFHRLNSPGIVVTNFACPDLSNEAILDEYSELIAQYLFYKNYPNDISTSIITSSNHQLSDLKTRIKAEFRTFYSEIITNSIIDIAALTVPIQRFINSSYFKNIVEYSTLPTKISSNITLDGLNSIKNNSLYKFFYSVHMQNKENILNKRVNTFIKGFSGLEDLPINLFDCLTIHSRIKYDNHYLKKDVLEIIKLFEKEKEIYQFLDKPNSHLLLDVVINQFAYPLHYNSRAIKRFSYKAKETEMFMDVIVLDECRYIYEWLPTLHQLKDALTNLSWQYVFRFALDGLIKQRMKYNNEYFFQGSVIPKEISGFENQEIAKREFLD